MGVEAVQEERRPRILIVDDEPDNIELVRRSLRGLGDLSHARSGSDALELLRDQDFAAIVTDHAMPGLTGVELLERAARIRPHAARILVSGYGDVAMLTEAINRGHVSLFLPKPIDPRKLRDLVKRAVAPPAQKTARALVLATGARHAYFGNDHWAKYAPGLKSVDDATMIRRRILLAFEQAEINNRYC